MRERRQTDFRLGSPPQPRSSGKDSGIQENWQFSDSYRSLGSARLEYDARYRVVSGREQQFYGGEFRIRSPSRLRIPESEKFGGNRCIPGLNRSDDPVRAETGRFVEMGSVHRGEYSEERDGQWQKVSGFNESLLGMGRESTFLKFQWDNLLGDGKPTNDNRNNLGGFSNSSVVPNSLSMENYGGFSSRTSFSHLMDPTESSRNYGLLDGVGGYISSSPLGKFEVREKRTNSVLDSTVDKIEGSNDIDNDNSSRDNIMMRGRERRALLEKETSFGEAEKELDSRSLNLNLDNLQFLEDYGFERRCGDGFERIPMSYKELYSTGTSSQLLVNPDEASEMRLRRKHSLDMEMDSANQKIILSSDWNAFNDIPDSSCGAGDWSYENFESLSTLENSRWGQCQDGSGGRMIDRVGIHGNASSGNSLSSKFVLLTKQRRSSKPVKSSKRDVRKRLGPVRSVKQRLGPVPSEGKNLGEASFVKRKLPWIKVQKGKPLEDFEQNLDVQGVKSTEVKKRRKAKTQPSEDSEAFKPEVKKKRYVKTEPPEDSEEFMQLVQSSFLKFMKLLNENSFNRRKYLEQGGAGILKCCICGSGSKEFSDTLSLAQHAFRSCKVGSRSEHLGFHKALCVLMGWNNEKVPKGQWVRQILPDTEASSLKEDLIIWPPVILIHNSSINYNLNERTIVSIEGLKDILKGMGCDQGMTNICRGKAANLSTMVVSFSGTFSGLREAERLHGLFGEKKHGRAEFQQIMLDGNEQNCQETRSLPGNKAESVLYGYLGIASDLDKLDFETKKRCVVKSKKEIEAIANATFNTE